MVSLILELVHRTPDGSGINVAGLNIADGSMESSLTPTGEAASDQISFGLSEILKEITSLEVFCQNN